MRSALIVLALLAGCATTATMPGPIKSAGADQVTACKYVDDVVGSSMWYGMFAAQGLDAARAEVLRNANLLGATHVVWNAPVTHFGGTSASGKAYRC
jgi:hypothetical protein